MIKINDFENHLKDTTLSERTVYSYTCAMKHYARFFDEVTTQNIQQYKRLCMKAQKPKTINLRLNALLKYIKWLHLDAEVSTIRIQEPLFAENLLTTVDYDKILNHLRSTDQIDWYIILRTLACTGVRISESYQIKVGDLRQSRKTIIGKGTKSRVIWFPQRYRSDILPLLKGRKDTDRIITHTDDYIRTKLRLLQKTLRIKCHLSPHEFRRYYARQVYAKTKDIYLVKDLLGHSSIKTTTRYLRINISSISRRLSRIIDW